MIDLIFDASTSGQQWAGLLRGPLERAAGQGNRVLAQKLVEAGAQVGDALHEAVRGGHGEVVEDLIGNGAPINAKDEDGQTPLHSAVVVGKPEMVQLLMLKGADIHAEVDRFLLPPLFLAARRGHLATTLALLSGGANTIIQSSHGGNFTWCVVHEAAIKGHVDVVRAVIEHGVGVNENGGANQLRALHYAASTNKAQVIDVLVECGANIEARDRHGLTPLHRASMTHSFEALTALLRHGAHVNAQGDHVDLTSRPRCIPISAQPPRPPGPGHKELPRWWTSC